MSKAVAHTVTTVVSPAEAHQASAEGPPSSRVAPPTARAYACLGPQLPSASAETLRLALDAVLLRTLSPYAQVVQLCYVQDFDLSGT
jgi:hypothetical protein